MIDIYSLPTKQEMKEKGVAELELAIRKIQKEEDIISKKILFITHEKNKILYEYSYYSKPTLNYLQQHLSSEIYDTYTTLLEQEQYCLQCIENWISFKEQAVKCIAEKQKIARTLSGVVRASYYGQYTDVFSRKVTKASHNHHYHGIRLA